MHRPCGQAYGFVIAATTATPLAVREGFTRNTSDTRGRRPGSIAPNRSASLAGPARIPLRHSSIFARWRASLVEISPERTASSRGARDEGAGPVTLCPLQSLNRRDVLSI